MRNNQLLSGIRLVNVGQNLPGPLAAQILGNMGAQVVKIEPPTGDPFEIYFQSWYEAMLIGAERRKIDLKSDAGQEEMAVLLADADILITSQRPAALDRIGLNPADLRTRFPALAIVNIVGSPSPNAHLPGHDLTYQGKAGLLEPPNLPRSLFSDLGGAQQAVIAALALLAAGGGVQEVALSEAARFFHAPIQYGATMPGSLLGGGHAGYNLYASADGWICVAALEPHFWSRLQKQVEGLPHNPLAPEGRDILSKHFARQPSQFWADWGERWDIPVEAVQTPAC